MDVEILTVLTCILQNSYQLINFKAYFTDSSDIQMPDVLLGKTTDC